MVILKITNGGDHQECVQQDSANEHRIQEGSKTMKPKTVEAFIYNREAFLKRRLDRDYNAKTAHRLEEVRYIKRQLQAMLREVKDDTR